MSARKTAQPVKELASTPDDLNPGSTLQKEVVLSPKYVTWYSWPHTNSK